MKAYEWDPTTVWFSWSESEMEIKSPSPETELFGRPPKPCPKRVCCPSGATAASHGSTHVSPGYASRARRYSNLVCALSPLKTQAASNYSPHRHVCMCMSPQGKKMKSSTDRLSMAVTGHVTSSSGDMARPMSCSSTHATSDGIWPGRWLLFFLGQPLLVVHALRGLHLLLHSMVAHRG